MPIDVDNSRTFGELALDLTIEVGKSSYGASGDAVASLPSDPETLARITWTLLRGIERFYGEDRQWSFLDHVETLTLSPDGSDPRCIDGDPARYLMPRHLRSGPKRSWEYADERVGRVTLAQRPYAEVLARRLRLDTTGIPAAFGWRTVAPSDEVAGSRKGMEMVFDVAPDAAYVLTAEFRSLPPKGVDLAERHWCGREMEEAMLACAVEAWYERDKDADGTLHARAAERRGRLVALARDIDRTKRLKTIAPRRRAEADPHDRINTSGMTVNGIPVG